MHSLHNQVIRFQVSCVVPRVLAAEQQASASWEELCLLQTSGEAHRVDHHNTITIEGVHTACSNRCIRSGAILA